MDKRRLGKSELEIAPLVFGGNVFGWTADEATSFTLLDAFVAEGFNCIDTADVYSRFAPGNVGGESETVIGKWLKRSGKRKEVIIATKVGMEMGPDQLGLAKSYIFRAVEDSLRRLQTDYIDLYQSHTDDTVAPLEERFEAYAKLMEQGKIRAIGASNYSAERLDAALRLSKERSLPCYQTLQPHYNLVERSDFEQNLQPTCQKHGISVIPYFSLASGFLTGKYRSEADLKKSPRGRLVKKYLNEPGFEILAALDEIATKHNATPAQISLAWLLTRPTVAAPIASATSVKQLQELIGATTLKLDTDSIERLNLASVVTVEDD